MPIACIQSYDILTLKFYHDPTSNNSKVLLKLFVTIQVSVLDA